MTIGSNTQTTHACCGLHIRVTGFADATTAARQALERMGAVDLLPLVHAEIVTNALGEQLNLRLNTTQAQAWAPGFDTLQLTTTLQLDTSNRPDDLTREIVVAMLMGPVAFEFPSLDELESAVRIRHNIVQAARKTTLAFHTSEAERPQDCWVYDEDYGFVIRPNVSIITALARATQPDVSGAL